MENFFMPFIAYSLVPIITIGVIIMFFKLLKYFFK